MEVGRSFQESRSASMEIGRSFHGSRRNFPLVHQIISPFQSTAMESSMDFGGRFHGSKRKLVEYSMEANLLPWKLMEASMEADGKFHRSRPKTKKQYDRRLTRWKHHEAPRMHDRLHGNPMEVSRKHGSLHGITPHA